MTKKQQFTMGMKAGIPVVFGFIPVAIAYSVMAGQAGLNMVQTCLMSVCVYAGASQMLAVGMLVQGAGIFSIILATFMLNFRHLIMSTCVMKIIRSTKLSKKLVLSFGVTDEAFAIFTTVDEEKETSSFLLGLGGITYLSWVIGTVIGCLANQILPVIVQDSLGIALYAMFIGLLFPNLKKGVEILFIVVIAMILSVIFNCFLPSSWAMIVTTLVGAAIGVLITEKKEIGEQTC